MSFNTQFWVQKPDDARRDTFGTKQTQWSRLEKFGQLIPLTARDYEFANVYGTVLSQNKIRTWLDSDTSSITKDTNIDLGGKLHNVVFTRPVPNMGMMGVYDGSGLIDIYLESNQ